jgi:L-amino acid N-acyltransferase YncA
VFGCLKQAGYKFGRWLDVVYMELVLAAAKKKRKR